MTWHERRRHAPSRPVGSGLMPCPGSPGVVAALGLAGAGDIISCEWQRHSACTLARWAGGMAHARGSSRTLRWCLVLGADCPARKRHSGESRCEVLPGCPSVTWHPSSSTSLLARRCRRGTCASPASTSNCQQDGTRSIHSSPYRMAAHATATAQGTRGGGAVQLRPCSQWATCR